MTEKQQEARLAEIQKRWANIPVMDAGTADKGNKCEAYLYEKDFPHKLIATMADLYDMSRLTALAKSKDDIDYLLSLLQQPAPTSETAERLWSALHPSEQPASERCGECGHSGYVNGERVCTKQGGGYFGCGCKCVFSPSASEQS